LQYNAKKREVKEKEEKQENEREREVEERRRLEKEEEVQEKEQDEHDERKDEVEEEEEEEEEEEDEDEEEEDTDDSYFDTTDEDDGFNSDGVHADEIDGKNSCNITTLTHLRMGKILTTLLLTARGRIDKEWLDNRYWTCITTQFYWVVRINGYGVGYVHDCFVCACFCRKVFVVAFWLQFRIAFVSVYWLLLWFEDLLLYKSHSFLFPNRSRDKKHECHLARRLSSDAR
jgi:hypothetical protein